MKLQFDANQKYQLKAIKSVVDLFKGQPSGAGGFRLEQMFADDHYLFNTQFVVGNRLVLDEGQVLENLREVQRRNDVQPSEELDGLHFSLEMETGTGKTYVYLRTIHELHRTYGFKKFIIVVPSLAIKEGVLKNLEITREHFDMLYERPEMDFCVYDPKKRGLSRSFATTNSLQILVMNIDQFARAGNIIYQDSDWGVPIEYIKSVRPIVIVDEPQNMETENRRQAIANLEPLCTLRYSATHKFTYNLIYRLDPVRAYDLGLVKRIEVDGIEAEDAANEAYVEVKSVTSRKTRVRAKIKIDVSTSEGVKKKEVTVGSGDDLYELSGQRDVYKDGFIVDELDVSEKAITFNNGRSICAGQKIGGLSDAVMKYQIEETVRDHFEKERRLKDKGIKVLSLFFIDRVANYREYRDGNAIKGKIAEWFEEAFEKISREAKYDGLIAYSAWEVHNGYFSQDKKGILKDTRGDSQADNDTYALIMKEKERLLSVSEPLRFIFSHSALKEGWDNPNVFQICTLNETRSEMRKRQEIGRGMRLPVNQNGQRVFDTNINTLTVVANESYEDFARGLQSEIEEECGVEFTGRVKNKRKRRRAKLKKGYALDENFKALWERIEQRTRYRVEYKTGELVERAGRAISDLAITSPKLISRRARIGITSEMVSGEVVMERKLAVDAKAREVPDVLGAIQSKTRLTKDTILKIIVRSGKVGEILTNPQQFIDKAVGEINRILREMMVDGIKYEKIAGKVWKMTLFKSEELESYLEKMVKVQDREKTLYDYVLVDSDVERRFARELESREDIKFYFKLPSWFKIETPIGKYSPDWAFVFENDRRIYFVAETKGGEDLRESERMRIRCGRKHFGELEEVVFRGPVSSLGEVVHGG